MENTTKEEDRNVTQNSSENVRVETNPLWRSLTVALKDGKASLANFFRTIEHWHESVLDRTKFSKDMLANMSEHLDLMNETSNDLETFFGDNVLRVFAEEELPDAGNSL